MTIFREEKHHTLSDRLVASRFTPRPAFASCSRLCFEFPPSLWEPLPEYRYARARHTQPTSFHNFVFLRSCSLVARSASHRRTCSKLKMRRQIWTEFVTFRFLYRDTFPTGKSSQLFCLEGQAAVTLFMKKNVTSWLFSPY